MNDKVLFVDDESNILDSYRRSLRKVFAVETALSGAEALEVMESKGPFSVVISDMRMPGMNGVEFLAEAKKKAPDTVRMMLTGNSDQQTAIDAVNQGDVFRFLNKPCEPKEMAVSVQAAIKQHHLLKAEKELLENTLKGGLMALVEVLSISKPEVFGRSNRYKEHLIDCAEVLGIKVNWHLETLAVASLIGTVSLTDDLVEKALSGSKLSAKETTEFNQHAIAGAKLLENIPRLEKLASNIRYQRKNYDGSGTPNDDLKESEIPFGARLLRVISDFDTLQQSGMEAGQALNELAEEAYKYDPRMLDALGEAQAKKQCAKTTRVKISESIENMQLAEDVTTNTGSILLAKGQILTPPVLKRLINFSLNGVVEETITVAISE